MCFILSSMPSFLFTMVLSLCQAFLTLRYFISFRLLASDIRTPWLLSGRVIRTRTSTKVSKSADVFIVSTSCSVARCSFLLGSLLLLSLTPNRASICSMLCCHSAIESRSQRHAPTRVYEVNTSAFRMTPRTLFGPVSEERKRNQPYNGSQPFCEALLYPDV